jgi:hypothetical protein
LGTVRFSQRIQDGNEQGSYREAAGPITIAAE